MLEQKQIKIVRSELNSAQPTNNDGLLNIELVPFEFFEIKRMIKHQVEK